MKTNNPMLILCTLLALSACTPQSVDRGQAYASTLPETNSKAFEKDVIDSDVPVLVDFYAVWSEPCRSMEPVLHDLSTMYDGKAKVVRVNVDENPELAKRFRIRAIPHMMLFKNGDLVDDVLGKSTKQRLSYTMERAL